MNLARQLMTLQCFYSGAYFTAGLVSNTPKSHFNKACIYSEQYVMANVIWVWQADSSSSTWFTEVFVLVLCICTIVGTELDFWEHKAMLWYQEWMWLCAPRLKWRFSVFNHRKELFIEMGIWTFSCTVMKCVWVKWSPLNHNPKSIL